MQLQTYAQAKAQVEVETDTQDESIITPEEMLGYFNSGIAKAEATIQGLFELYFLRSAYLSLTLGEEEVDLPADLYAYKIVKVYFKDGLDRYEVTRIRLSDIVDVEDTDEYQYNLESGTAGEGAKLILYPAAKETDQTKMRIWYIRNANRMVDDSSVIDIPEFVEFVRLFVKCEVGVKVGHQLLAVWIQQRDVAEQAMKDTLATMVLDGNEQVEWDLSHYEDHS